MEGSMHGVLNSTWIDLDFFFEQLWEFKQLVLWTREKGPVMLVPWAFMLVPSSCRGCSVPSSG